MDIPQDKMESLPKGEEDSSGQVTVSPAANMIFSQVIATVAMELLDQVPGDKELFVRGFMSEDLGLHHNQESGALSVFGMLDEIIKCRNKLAEFMGGDSAADRLAEGVAETARIGSDEAERDLGFGKKSYVNVGITCDLLTDREETRDSDTVNARSVDENSEDVIAKNSDAYAENNDETTNITDEAADNNDITSENSERITENNDKTDQGEDRAASLSESVPSVSEATVKPVSETVSSFSSVLDADVSSASKTEKHDDTDTGGNKPVALSRRGRIIKRPLKLEDSGIDAGKLDEEPAEIFKDIVEPEIKRKRVLHPRKRKGGPRAKDRDKISVEEVRRLVQEEKEKEAREKGEEVKEAVNEPEKDTELLNASVLQNIHAFLNVSDLQVQEAQRDTVKLFSDMKAADEVKKMKKYYEDRMPFKFFCAHCSFKTKRESHYKQHMRLHESNPCRELHKCDQCDFTTIRLGTLRRHYLTHVQNLLECSACNYQTTNFKQLENHKRRHARRQTMDFMPKLKCSVCNYMTLSKAKLVAHMDLHRNADGETLFSCSQCKYKSKRKEHLVRHKNNVHSNKRPFLCDLCGTAFKRVDALAAHKTTHIDKHLRKLPYQCMHCKKGFKSAAHLKEHMSVHTTVRSFQCHICGQMFKTRAVQRRHQQSIHFNPRSHRCTKCNKDFNTKYAFNRHMRIHDSDFAGFLPTPLQPAVATETEKSEDKEAVAAVTTEDENVSAIQTITIAQENLGEFTQQLQNVSDQLQSATDIGEICIQGMESVEAVESTASIIDFQGQEVRQIYVPGESTATTSDLGPAPTSADQIKQIFIISKSDSDLGSNQIADSKTNVSVAEDPEVIKQILISPDGTSLNVTGLKEFFIQTEDGTEPVRHILIPSVDGTLPADFPVTTETLSTVLEGVGGQQGLIVQSEQSKGAEGEGTEEKTELGGGTFQIKLDNGQTLLTLGSTVVQNL